MQVHVGTVGAVSPVHSPGSGTPDAGGCSTVSPWEGGGPPRPPLSPMRTGLDSLEGPVDVKWVRRLLLLADGDIGSAHTHTHRSLLFAIVLAVCRA